MAFLVLLIVSMVHIFLSTLHNFITINNSDEDIEQNDIFYEILSKDIITNPLYFKVASVAVMLTTGFFLLPVGALLYI